MIPRSASGRGVRLTPLTMPWQRGPVLLGPSLLYKPLPPRVLGDVQLLHVLPLSPRRLLLYA